VDTDTQQLGQNDDNQNDGNTNAQAQEFPGSMTNEERKAALEAIIYAADEPATIDQLASALGEEKLAVQASLDELVAGYASEERGIEIRAVAGGYKLYTKPQHHDLVRRFIKSLRPPLRLTMPALETLAVISYKQPVTAPEIQEIRGVNTSGVIKTLLDKKLITTAGRKEVIGRPILYRTSKEFLMRFGLSDLGELPSLKEFEALAREALGTDEGVSEPGAGDESVLDSIEPGAEELGEELIDGSESGEIAESGPVTEAGAVEAVADTTVDAHAEQVETPAAEPSESDSPQVNAVSSSNEPQAQATETVADESPTSEPPAEESQAHARSTDATEPQAAPFEPGVIIEARTPETAEAVHPPQFEMMQPAEPISAEAVAQPDEHEISEELLAQLARGIEVEGSADMFVSQSGAELSSEVPAEEAPAAFYSSDAEPEAIASSPEPITEATPAPESETEQSPSAESQPDQPEQNQKSHRAAAGE
jgi:segregation and condensation protein B